MKQQAWADAVVPIRGSGAPNSAPGGLARGGGLVPHARRAAHLDVKSTMALGLGLQQGLPRQNRPGALVWVLISSPASAIRTISHVYLSALHFVVVLLHDCKNPITIVDSEVFIPPLASTTPDKYQI